MIVSYDRKWEGEVRECGGMNECKSGIKRVFDVFIDLRRPHYRDTTNTKTASCGHRPVLGSHHRSDLDRVHGAEQVDRVDVCLDRDETVVLHVPSAGCRRLHACAIILLNHARYNVLHGLLELGQLLDAVLDDLLRPLRDLVAVVDRVRVENTRDHITHQLLDLGRVELRVVLKVCHF